LTICCSWVTVTLPAAPTLATGSARTALFASAQIASACLMKASWLIALLVELPVLTVSMELVSESLPPQPATTTAAATAKTPASRWFWRARPTWARVQRADVIFSPYPG
jgi:hypothetical protein